MPGKTESSAEPDLFSGSLFDNAPVSIEWYARRQRELYEAGVKSAVAYWAAKGKKWVPSTR